MSCKCVCASRPSVGRDGRPRCGRGRGGREGTKTAAERAEITRVILLLSRGESFVCSFICLFNVLFVRGVPSFDELSDGPKAVRNCFTTLVYTHARTHTHSRYSSLLSQKITYEQ